MIFILIAYVIKSMRQKNQAKEKQNLGLVGYHNCSRGICLHPLIPIPTPKDA